MTSRLSVAVVGAGTMGANHVRVIACHAETELVAIVDTDVDRAVALSHNFGGHAISSIDELPNCDAVVIAAPTESHASLAGRLIERGIPLLVEKPLSDTTDDVQTMIGHARRSGVPLMCGFVERFNPAISTAIDHLDGEPIHVTSVRHSPVTPRIRTSVVHDLLIHDIDLALRLNAGSHVASTVSATWKAPSGVVDLADCTIVFDGGQIATLSASRASQRKIRSLSIATASSLIEVDLLRHDVTIYRHRFHDLQRTGPGYRAETVVDIPFVRHEGEPLSLQLSHFVRLVRGERDMHQELDTLLAPHVLAAEIAAARASQTGAKQ